MSPWDPDGERLQRIEASLRDLSDRVTKVEDTVNAATGIFRELVGRVVNVERSIRGMLHRPRQEGDD